jgi:hypothetical protein
MDEDAQLRLWLLKCFRDLGFDRAQAEFLYLAAIDWHEMERLLSEGCSPELAEKILA